MAEYSVDKFTYNSNTYKFIDNTSGYVKTSSAAASGGTALSLVTTGEKYTWNNKSNLALGTTSSTAYRGDYGNTAYSHATDSSRLTTATSSGLYKIASTAQGHIASLTAISKTDITGLGIPAQDTTYSSLTAASGGTAVSLVTTGQKYTWNNKSNLAIGTTASTAAAGNHAHGNITNAGDITTTATIASGDRIVINDESASKITNSSITFGTSTTTFLRNDGTWATPTGGSGGGVSDTASYLNAPSESGYQTDEYGNLLHKRSNTNDCFNLKNYGTDGTDRTTTLKMYFDNGNIESTGTIISTKNDNSEVFKAGANNYRYHISIGNRWLWVRDSGTDGVAPSSTSTAYGLVLTPNSLNIMDGWSTASGSYTQRSLLTNTYLRFQDASGSTAVNYDVTPASITDWNSIIANPGTVRIKGYSYGTVTSATNRTFTLTANHQYAIFVFSYNINHPYNGIFLVSCDGSHNAVVTSVESSSALSSDPTLSGTTLTIKQAASSSTTNQGIKVWIMDLSL